MVFGPTNAPLFYTETTKYWKDKWDTLFIMRVEK